jgi:alpha-ketoglutarate-dependent taurine dioxygenase
LLTYKSLLGDDTGPLLIEAQPGGAPLAAAIDAALPEIRRLLAQHGALLFRGFPVASAADFHGAVSALSDDHLKYEYRSTPRSEVTDRVVTSTSYPAALEIPLHNENSYHHQWPLTIAFCCLEPAAEGGETPIAPMRRVQAQIGTDLVDEFESRRVEYVRHYHEGVDLSWQSVFQTDSRDEVLRFCEANGIRAEWLDGKLLRTSGTVQGVARHPATGERVFFNQAHLFHVSSLGAAHAEALTAMYGRDRLPRHARFGDGGEIPEATLRHIGKAFRDNEIVFPWQRGDVMVLDNMAYAHGRRPFKGKRQVLAALMDTYRQ